MRKLFALFAFAILALSVRAQVQVQGTNLYGGGQVASSPSITCGTITAFGNQVVNIPSAQFSTNCSNNGTNAFVTITSVVSSNGVFALGPSNTCVATLSLGVGQSCVVAVIFTPTALTSYSANVTVTASGATGSPQVLAVSGTGVNSGGGGGPSGYTAPTQAAGALGYTGFTPCTTSSCAGLPAEGGTISTDTNFVHTSSGGISGSAFTAQFQCAGQNAAVAAQALPGGTNIATPATSGGYADWLMPAGGQEAVFSLDLKYLYLHTRSQGAIFSFDWAHAKCTPLQVFASTSTIGAGAGVLEANLSPGSKEDVYYGYTLPSTNPGFAQIDFTAGVPGVVTALTGNLNSIPNMCGSVAYGVSHPGQNVLQESGTGGIGNSNDSIALGFDNILGTAIGFTGEVESNWSCAAYYQAASAGSGKFGAVAWWNVKQDAMDSTSSCYLTTCTAYAPWTGGWPSCSSSCTGLGGPTCKQGIHAVTMDWTGNYSVIAAVCTFTTGPTVLAMGTRTATQATPLSNNGHFANIGPYLCSLTSNGPSSKVLCVAFTAPGTIAYSATRFPATIMDQHNNGNGVNPTVTSGTVGTLGYCNNAPGGCNGPQPTQAGTQEVMMFTPPPLTGTWTPLWYRFTHSNMDTINGGGSSGNFWAETTGNPDSTGKWYCYPTNWGASLGTSGQTQSPPTPGFGLSGFPRIVVMCAELR